MRTSRGKTPSGKGRLGEAVVRVYGRGRYLTYTLLAFAGGALLLLTPNMTKYYEDLRPLYLGERITGGAVILLGLWYLFLFARALVLREDGLELYTALGRKALAFDDCTFTLLRTDRPFFTMLQYNRSEVTGRMITWEYTVHVQGSDQTLILSNKYLKNLEDKITEFNVRQKEAGRRPIECTQVKDVFVKNPALMDE